MHIYYINLEHRFDRRQAIERYLSKLPVTYSRIPAVYLDSDLLHEKNGPYKDILNRLKHPFTDQRRNRGVIGCFLSHTLAYQRAVTEQKSNFIIVEDDVRLSSSFIKEFNYRTEFLNEVDWDIYRSVWKNMKVNGKLVRENVHKFDTCHRYSKFSKEVNNPHGAYGGSHFTYVNYKSAQKVVDYLNEEHIYALDAVLGTHKINAYADILKTVHFERPGSKDIPKK